MTVSESAGAVARSEFAALEPTAFRADARALRESIELLERVRRNDIAEVEAFEVWLNRAMILLAGVDGISLALLGRRLHALAAASRADRDRLAEEGARRARLIRGPGDQRPRADPGGRRQPALQRDPIYAARR